MARCVDSVSDDTCDNCIDVGAAIENTAHSIYGSSSTSGISIGELTSLVRSCTLVLAFCKC